MRKRKTEIEGDWAIARLPEEIGIFKMLRFKMLIRSKKAQKNVPWLELAWRIITKGANFFKFRLG